MRILFCGDIVGRSGRDAVISHVPRLRQALALDFVVANGENIAGGFGMTVALARERLGGTVAAIVVDMHAEATSEKQAMGHALDGRVSMVVGSHSHVPTADAQILPGGTAFQTDAGMCGDYDSVIGMKKQVPI